MSESRNTMIRRLRMRSMRRGIKEMDLILDEYANRNLDAMDEDALHLYDALLEENDQDLYRWVTGQEPGPERFAALIGEISVVFQK